MYRIQQFELTGSRPQPLRLHAGSDLRVSDGRLWVTAEGHADDVWLDPGQRWRCARTMRVWLSAEPRALFQLLTPQADCR